MTTRGRLLLQPAVPTTFRTGTAIERSPISSSWSLSAKPSCRTLARISSRRLREVTVCLVCWMKSTFASSEFTCSSVR